MDSCASCIHWKPDNYDKLKGECNQLKNVLEMYICSDGSYYHVDTIETPHYFYCNEYEKDGK